MLRVLDVVRDGWGGQDCEFTSMTFFTAFPILQGGEDEGDISASGVFVPIQGQAEDLQGQHGGGHGLAHRRLLTRSMRSKGSSRWPTRSKAEVKTQSTINSNVVETMSKFHFDTCKDESDN